jgi:hypothetical protein
MVSVVSGMKRLIRGAAIGVFALCLSSPAYAGVAQDDPDDVPPPAELLAINSAVANGSGCKPGTYDIDVLPDNTGFRITFRAFKAQVGGGAPVTDFRKNCQLGMYVVPPSGYTYAIARIGSRGSDELARGAQGVHRTLHYYAGSSTTGWRVHNFQGPSNDEWQIVDEIAPPDRIWVPCSEQRHLNANSELRVQRGTSDPATISSMTLDSMTYRIAWRRCP